jgi:hypothetical protein
MMIVNLLLRRSRRLLASSQTFACSTTQRVEPIPDPCALPILRMNGRMPSARQAKPAVRGAVVFGIGVEPGARHTDSQSMAQQGGNLLCSVLLSGLACSAAASGRKRPCIEKIGGPRAADVFRD